MYGSSQILRFVLLALALVSSAQSGNVKRMLKLEKASFKATYVQDGEKIQRVRVTTDAENVKEMGIDKFVVNAGDSIGAQASVVNEEDETVAVSQLFLRFLNKRTMEDNIYVLRKKGRDMKLDFGLNKEVRKDLDFWERDATYRVEMIYGDVKLVESGIWLITDNMKFSEDSARVFKERERGVFDFDIGARWSVGPEFEAPVPEREKRAAPLVIVMAVIGVVVPFFVLIGAWMKMGALNISLPEKGKGAAVGLEICILGHAIALGMFWWQWNIVTTWKVMGIVMMPTLTFARSFLQADDETETNR